MWREIKIILISYCLLLTSCGNYDRIEDGKFTEVTFRNTNTANSSDPAAKTPQSSGILIYMHSDTFATNMNLPDEFAPASIRLPNGSYAFFAFAYNSAGTPFAATTKCDAIGVANRIVLDGTARTIALNLTSAGCANGVFIDSSNFLDGSNFNKIEVVHCGSSIGTGLAALTPTTNCSSNPWTAILAYRFHAPIYKIENGNYSTLSSGLVSACNVAGTSGLPSTPTDRFPVGSMQGGHIDVFSLEMESFTDASCTSSPFVHRFRRGLIFGPDPDLSILGRALANTSTTNFTRLFIRQP